MIEVKNLVKRYNDKSNQPVLALDNISFTLPDTGLVFILGKSGSGKTTLLNMLGGLDSYNEGEIVVFGKSTKKFSKSDFDAYRNTCVGFIFQEYNLIENMFVEKNLELALKLQNGTATQEQINDILKQVDLKNYGDRMPDELSTGQKQRITIARALIKSSKIILADEPTSALDYKTGNEILTILKKLSKEKLIVVITHDREFAELYGDRIIEISDGKIIHDVEKNENSVFGDTKQVITKDENVNFILKKGKLPFSTSLKMASANLTRNPFRLFLMILLSSIAFILFGVSDSFSHYQQSKVTLKSMYDSNINYISLTKTQKYLDSPGNSYFQDQPMNQSDLNFIENQFSTYNFFPVINLNDVHVYSLNDQNITYAEYVSTIKGSVELTSQFVKAMQPDLIAGNFPNENTDDNEINISEYLFEQFKFFGFLNGDGTVIDIQKPNDLIGRTIKINDQNYLISGIIDTHLDMDRYLNSSENSNFEGFSATTQEEFYSNIDHGLSNLIYVREGYYDDHPISSDNINYRFVLTSLKHQYNEDIKLVNFSFKLDHDIRYKIYNNITVDLNKNGYLIDKASHIFLYVGLGLAIFASLLMFNFISTNINAKRNEIGILRALGTKSKDLFIIFLLESLIIGIINFIISSIGTYASILYLNHYIRIKSQYLITLLYYGARQAIYLLLLSLFIAFISSYVPIAQIARKKPIDLIKYD